MSKLTIYKASAGSGKTFKLTEEFILQAFRYSNNYKRILAVTFTNKATSEMKSRILLHLYFLATQQDSPYLDIIKNRYKLNDQQVYAKAQEILSHILHDYSKFSVGTIDQFFQKIVRAFTREINLQPIYTVELDGPGLLSQVTDELIQTVDENNELKEWLVDFANKNLEDERQWDLKDDILKFAREIFSEKYKEYELEISKKVSDKNFLKSYIAELAKIISQFEKTLISFGKQGLELISSNGLAIEDFKYGKSSFATYFKKLEQKGDFEPKKRVLDALDNLDNWATKTADKKDLIDAVFPKLNPVLKSAIEYYKDNLENYNSALSIRRYINIVGILSDISTKVREYCDEQSIFLLSDAGQLINAIIDDNDTPFIYEKTGNYFRHFMIDEFQDTSRIQWANFKPLIFNSLSQGSDNLVVGDIKQSIYRWRNSDWDILESGIEKDFHQEYLHTENLQFNWRSLRNVIDFNNHIFFHTSVLLQNHLNNQLPEKEELSEFTGKIKHAYADLIQQVPGNNHGGGYIRHEFIASDDDQKWKRKASERIPEMIVNLQEKGYSLKDIAILVRTGREGQMAANALMEYQEQNSNSKYQLDFISNDSLFIANSVSVQLIVGIMNYLINPYDAINRAKIIYDYKAILQDRIEESELHKLFHNQQRELEKILPQGFIEKKAILTKSPVFELTSEIIEIFKLNSNKDEIPFIQAFQDSIQEFAQSGRNDIAAFLEWWEDKGQKATLNVSDNQDAIKIMTIHKSKGLEFGAVIIPFCDWDIDHNAFMDNILWCTPKTEPFNKLDLVPVKYEKKLEQSIFANEYFEEKLHAYVDNLNLLYVAFTRAAEQLYIISEEKNRKEFKISSVGDLLRFSYENAEANDQLPIQLPNHWKAGELVFEYGEQAPPTELKEDSNNTIKIKDYPVFNHRNSLRIKAEDDFFNQPKDTHDMQNVNRGRLMHEVFENIETPKDISAAIDKMIFEGKLTSDEKNELIASIEKALEDEEIKIWFDERWQVKTERELIAEDGTILRPDRVISDINETIIIDYKFGEHKENKHKSQVRRYMNTLQKMGYQNLKGYLWYVELEETVLINNE